MSAELQRQVEAAGGIAVAGLVLALVALIVAVVALVAAL